LSTHQLPVPAGAAAIPESILSNALFRKDGLSSLNASLIWRKINGLSRRIHVMNNPVLIGNATLHLGDCVEVMATMPDNSLDSIICDPPYLINFMGKMFDSQHKSLPGANEGQKMQEWHRRWVTEAYRILRPGGHLAAFGGDRTHHRLMSAMEDVGFELRFNCYWIFSTGFPKSQNASMAIDQHFGVKDRREVIGDNKFLGKNGKQNVNCYGKSSRPDESIPAHELAKQWSGYGTALKPSVEIACVGRKPMIGTLAENLLEWGCGAMNLDACRVAIDESVDDPRLGGKGSWKTEGMAKNVYEGGYRGDVNSSSPLGRFPPHLLHDGSAVVKKCFPDTGKSTGGNFSGGKETHAVGMFGIGKIEISRPLDEGGSASRFFPSLPYDEEDCATLSIQRCSLCGLLSRNENGIISELTGDISCLKNAKDVESNLSQGIGITHKDFVLHHALQNGLHNKEDSKERLKSHAEPAEKNLNHSPVITNYTAQKSAEQQRELKIAKNAKNAGNLCDSCAIAIAQNLAVIRQGNCLDSLLGLDFISGRKQQILIQNLVRFAALLEDIDTIPTTESLSLLFGSVFHAIENNIEEESATDQTSFIKYNSKASKKDRDEGCDALDEKRSRKWRDDKGMTLTGSGNPRTEMSRNNHVSVKPTSLMRWLCRLLTPKGGTLLDPFMGSGSTLKAAVLENFTCIGIEMDPDYFAIAEARTAHVSPDAVMVQATNPTKPTKAAPVQAGLFESVA
jgi:DNA modification methylase